MRKKTSSHAFRGTTAPHQASWLKDTLVEGPPLGMSTGGGKVPPPSPGSKGEEALRVRGVPGKGTPKEPLGVGSEQASPVGAGSTSTRKPFVARGFSISLSPSPWSDRGAGSGKTAPAKPTTKMPRWKKVNPDPPCTPMRTKTTKRSPSTSSTRRTVPRAKETNQKGIDDSPTVQWYHGWQKKYYFDWCCWYWLGPRGEIVEHDARWDYAFAKHTPERATTTPGNTRPPLQRHHNSRSRRGGR